MSELDALHGPFAGLGPEDQARVVAALLLAGCLVLGAVTPVRRTGPRGRRPRLAWRRTPEPMTRLHRPPLPWTLERRAER